MSRLLFAAARGARIQLRQKTGEWTGARLVYIGELDSDFNPEFSSDRIHPDDEHLQYGPVSTALREMALTDDCADYVAPYIIFEIEKETGYWPSTIEQRCVFLLILAEALADSGL
jgi:hypothetical protein